MEKLYRWKKPILMIIDTAIVNLAYLTAFYFRFLSDIPGNYFSNYVWSSIPIAIISIVVFYIFGLYGSLWRYASIDELLLCIGAGGITVMLMIMFGAVTGLNIPHSVSVLAGIFTVIYIIGFRLSYRIYRRFLIYFNQLSKKDFKKVMIIGAGSAAQVIINEMKLNSESRYIPVVVIDDSKYKQGRNIAGVKVLGDTGSIKKVAEEKKIDEIIIAIPSLSVEDRKRIFELCNKTGRKTKIMPGLYELIEGRISLKQIRNVEIEDLLGRDQIELDSEGISEYISGKTILVTGGGGSIGSELCRQIARFNPKELLILDIYENNAYELQNELKARYPKLNLKVLIATVRDKRRLEKIFQEYKPEVVFHAAAHKHVALMEDNPTEAIKNNIFGTLNIAECADQFGTKRFVMISTDKAVNPTNIMGASKRVCEMIIQAMDKHSRTEFVAVRFGNVLGSNGSVIPLFKKQIANGGPVTVTNKYITRYFMTIPEAAQLVMQAGAYAKGGEIFVLDMGKPVKIYDLACDLIRLSGYEPHKDIKIEITGLRPGEKLYEELLMVEEGLGKTKHEKIFVGRPIFNDLEVLKRSFDEMKFIIENGSRDELIRKVEELVPTYKRTNNTEQREDPGKEVASTTEVKEVGRVVTAG